MLGLLRLAAGAASANAAAQAGQALRRALLMLVAALLALVALGFLTAAAWVALDRWQGPVVASLIMAGGFLILALIAALTAALGGKRHRHHKVEAELAARQAEMAALLGTGAEALGKAPMVTMGGAFLAGLLLALRIRR